VGGRLRPTIRFNGLFGSAHRLVSNESHIGVDLPLSRFEKFQDGFCMLLDCTVLEFLVSTPNFADQQRKLKLVEDSITVPIDESKAVGVGI
jgi:hypothetical protein